VLFKLRYRKFAGATDDLIDAKDISQAEQIGRTYCDQHAFKYIGVSSAVIATASILETGEALPAEAKPKEKARVGA
jgi:hypothetical protein